jgi:hypothetical protein
VDRRDLIRWNVDRRDVVRSNEDPWSEEGKKLIDESDLNVISAVLLKDAAEEVNNVVG